MKILVKFPTRNRPAKLFSTLDLYHNLAKNLDDMEFSITCDNDDASMNTEAIIHRIKSYKNTNVVFCNNKNKIEAVNNGMPNTPYDILMLVSDDMIPLVKNYDEHIRGVFAKYYPDLDGVVWLNDGHRGPGLNTLPIMGHKYYDRFKYIYNPDYITLYCDNEFGDVARLLNKCLYVDNVLIEHQHPSFGRCQKDALYVRNENSEWERHDKELYEKRKLNKFGMS